MARGRARTTSRRASKAKPSNTTAIAVTSFVGGMLAWHLFGGEQEVSAARPVDQRPQVRYRTARPARPSHPVEPSGLKLEDGRLQIEDWSKWMKWIPSKMNLALDAGAKTAGDVLKVLLNLALPGHTWPPETRSPMREQWDRLQTVVAEALRLPDLPPSGGSEEADETEERPVKLRLVT